MVTNNPRFSVAYNIDAETRKAIEVSVKPQRLRPKYIYVDNTKTSEYEDGRYEFYIDSDDPYLDGCKVDVIVPREVYDFDYSEIRKGVRPYLQLVDYEVTDIDNFGNLQVEVEDLNVSDKADEDNVDLD